MSLIPDDTVLAEGEDYLLVETRDGYQIWSVADYPAQRRKRMPDDEYVRTSAGLSAAWNAFGVLEPKAAESQAPPSVVLAADPPMPAAWSSQVLVTTRFELAGHRILKESE